MDSLKRNYVFVPGSFHGAWCWFKMQPLLNKNGNTSLALDLPGHGKDTTPTHEITLDSYVDAVCSAIEKMDTQVILIGHSRAGIVISQVAERIPQKMEKLVYLCAFLIPNGEPMVATALSDTGSALVSNLLFNEAEGWHMLNENAIKEAFYHDCTEEDVWLCTTLLSKEPNVPVATPLHLSDANFGSVRKVYIKTSEDKTITPALQDRMIHRIPVNEVYTLKSSHSPFLSQPKELADILINKI